MDMVLVGQFLPKAVHQGGDTTHGLVFVQLTICHERWELGHGLRRGAVVHNALAQ